MLPIKYNKCYFVYIRRKTTFEIFRWISLSKNIFFLKWVFVHVIVDDISAHYSIFDTYLRTHNVWLSVSINLDCHKISCVKVASYDMFGNGNEERKIWDAFIETIKMISLHYGLWRKVACDKC